MYYSDSLAYRVDVFDYDPATGDDRPAAASSCRSARGDYVPDGLAVDAEGGVWVAHWGGGVLCRYLTRTGSWTGRCGSRTRTSPAARSAGPDLDQLYITTAAGPADPAGRAVPAGAGRAGAAELPVRRLTARCHLACWRRAGDS